MDDVDLGKQPFTCVWQDPLVGEVYVSFDVGDRPEKMATNLFDLLPETSGELLFGGSQGQRRAGPYDVHHCLRLGEVHLTVKKGPSREFAWLSRAGLGVQYCLEQTGGDQHTSMAVELCHVLSGIAVGRSENDSHSFI